MEHLNIEIKAKCNDPAYIRSYLENNNAALKGTDLQTDTYFNVANGRLKLREGRIENNLIYYERSNQTGPKDSKFHLVQVEDAQGLKEVLTRSNGVKVIVKKKREIWYIDNVKFHIDIVEELGSFIEIEAGNLLADLPREKLQEQCDHYLHAFAIKDGDLLAVSYSDLLLGKNGPVPENIT